MSRIVIDVVTGEQRIVPLTQEEIADIPSSAPNGLSIDEAYFVNQQGKLEIKPQEQLDAITAQKAKRQENLEARAENAENATIKYLTTHTSAQIATYVQNNVTDLASAKLLLSRLAIAIGVMLR